MAQDKSWMEGQRFQGTVKFWRGSFGWLSCDAVTEKMGPRDVFLHRNDLNSVPVVADAVEFGLILDAKGQPKATNAIIVNSQKPHGKSPGGAAAKQGLGDSQVKRAALMLFRGSDVLVIQEMKEQSLMWSDLGGKVEPGEGILACALRELDEEARGFLSEDSIALLKKGVEMQFGDGKQPPEIVALKTTGSKPQSVAVFPLDCSGVELELLSPEKPNAFGVHKMCWLSRNHPDFKDKGRTRWPLLRAMCALRNATSATGRERSRSRSPRRQS